MKLEFGTGSRFGRLNFKYAKNIVDYAIKLGIKRFDTGYTYGRFYPYQALAVRLGRNR